MPIRIPKAFRTIPVHGPEWERALETGARIRAQRTWWTAAVEPRELPRPPEPSTSHTLEMPNG